MGDGVKPVKANTPCGQPGEQGERGATVQWPFPAVPAANQPRVRLQAAQTDSMTGTSTRTPTTVARAAPEPGPYRAMAVATASSKKLLVPIRAPGAAMPCGTPSS